MNCCNFVAIMEEADSWEATAIIHKLGQVSQHMSQHASQACAVLMIYKELIAIPSLPFSKCAHTMWCHTDITRLNRKVSRVHPHKKVIHMCIYACMKSCIK